MYRNLTAASFNKLYGNIRIDICLINTGKHFFSVLLLKPTKRPGRAMMGGQENSSFTAQEATDWLIIYSFFTSNLVHCLRNFCINLGSWNDFDLWFFSFLKNIHSWNFKFDSQITNHELLIPTLSSAKEGEK